MINRILIRIKVVQLLYSYLLLQKDFMIESQPTPPTKEKRFAYAVYLDTLALFVKIAQSIEKRGGSKPLLDNRFIRNLLADEKIKSQLAKFDAGATHFGPALSAVVDAVKESGVYKNFLKADGESTSASDLRIWADLYSTVISVNPRYRAAAAEIENHTDRGMERAADLVRETFKNYLSSQGNLADAIKMLRESLFAARELYFRLMLLPVALVDIRERQIDENRHKYILTDEDINPNMRFVENQLVEVIRVSPAIEKFAHENDIDWVAEDRVMLESLLREIMDSEIYKDYMEFPVTDFHTDTEFWRNIFKNVIFRSETFLEALEYKSVFWNDDIDIIGTFMLKTFKRIDEGMREEAIFEMYKDLEDSNFGPELFGAVARNIDAYRTLINDTLNKEDWDTDRLAFMDVVICLTAIAEIINFPKIPLQVSLNEYIEIAKCYSTAKSGTFIHGLLADIIERLKADKIVAKSE